MSQKTVSAFFDSYATDFDAIYGNKHTLLNQFVNRHFRKSMRMRYEKTIEGCEPISGRSVIDIGCGPGHYSVTLAKHGAAHVFGLDFAQSMLDVAKRHAEQAGVGDRCQWDLGDFVTYPINRKYDYAIVMGFMDYIAKPMDVIKKVLSITTRRAFFSFPAGGGLLAWQRKLRYQSRCELYMYTQPQIAELFKQATDRRVTIDPIARDFFVTAHVES